MVIALPLVFLLGACSQVATEDAQRVLPVKTTVVTPGDELRQLSFPGKVVAPKTAELGFEELKAAQQLLEKSPVARQQVIDSAGTYDSRIQWGPRKTVPRHHSGSGPDRRSKDADIQCPVCHEGSR